ncbi:hypothetical protein PI125_g6195 [Phytophthora idaei]|nr:hypothetical protein PI125_g6195 [Phytophthora idaei]
MEAVVQLVACTSAEDVDLAVQAMGGRPPLRSGGLQLLKSTWRR